MTEIQKTLVLVGAAVVLAVLAFLLAPARVTPEAFLDQGEPFYPDFTDPNEATSLEVIRYDNASGTAVPFKVVFENGVWTIPSHHDYPADGKDRLAQTAAGIIQLTKDDFRTANVSEHARCGVIDPLDMAAPGSSGRGARVTIRGEGGKLLADFIVGDTVPGQPGYRFVRLPEQNRVYAAKFDVDISARFADWIETNLLEVAKAKIDRLEFKNYTVNERTASIANHDEFSLTKSDGGWIMKPLKSGRELDTNKVMKLLTNLEGLSVVGVRPKPPGLSAILAGTSDNNTITMSDRASLQTKGFYLSRQGGLLSNEGELLVHTDQGVLYTLRFGEVFYGSGLEVSAGLDSAESAAGQGDGESRENRYLLVTVQFDAGAFGSPPRVRDSSFLGKPDSLLTDADRAARTKYNERKAWDKKVNEGREIVEKLNSRFADWYYVIPGDSFDKVHLAREALYVEAKS